MAASASTHAQLIQASWARCREHGLQPQHAPDFDCLTRAELAPCSNAPGAATPYP
jgi:transcriptional regulator of acetoin/glycerol metabolism